MTDLADVKIVVKADVAVRDTTLFDNLPREIAFAETDGRIFTTLSEIRDFLDSDCGPDPEITEFFEHLVYEIKHDMDVEIYLEEE